jgi:glycosyltransferase involved in cell wall biosynthesis
LKIPDKKISVVYNSVQLSKNENCPKGFNVKDYILYVNTLSEYKNVYTLLKAYKELRDENTKYILVIVGRSSSYWEEKMLPYIEKNHLSSYIVHLQNLTNEELKYMYSHASLFVTTSTREGFGYTPIEAAMCECPVVSSTCEALPDTTQGLVTYYEPVYDEHALKQKMLEALKTPQSKLVLIKNKFLYDYSPKVQFEKIYKILSND